MTFLYRFWKFAGKLLKRFGTGNNLRQIQELSSVRIVIYNRKACNYKYISEPILVFISIRFSDVFMA